MPAFSETGHICIWRNRLSTAMLSVRFWKNLRIVACSAPALLFSPATFAQAQSSKQMWRCGTLYTDNPAGCPAGTRPEPWKPRPAPAGTPTFPGSDGQHTHLVKASEAFSTEGGALRTAQRLFAALEQRIASVDEWVVHVAEIESKLGRFALTDRLVAKVERDSPLLAAKARSYRGATQSAQVEALVMRAVNAIPREKLGDIAETASDAALPLARVGKADLAEKLLGIAAKTAGSAMARDDLGYLLMANVVRGYGDLGSRDKLLQSVNPSLLKVGPLSFNDMLGVGLYQSAQDAIRIKQDRIASTLSCEVAGALVKLGDLEGALRVFSERKGEAGYPPLVHEAAADLAAGLVRAKRYSEAEAFMRISHDAMRRLDERIYILGEYKSIGRVRLAAALAEDGKFERSDEVLNWFPRDNGTFYKARYEDARSIERGYVLAKAGRVDEAMALLRDVSPATLANGSSRYVTVPIALQIVRGFLALPWVP